jgi:rhomboid family GlyGly-CTERM serine protease
VLAGLAGLAYALPGATAWLELDRSGALAGELWRLLSGHFTHWNLAHLAWDGVAFAALGSQCWQASRALFWRCLLGSALAVSVVVLACQPEIHIYRGLSGIDAAFFAALSVDKLRDASRARRRGPLLVVAATGALFAAKLIYEVVTATAFFVDLGPGVVPLPLAHLVGAAVGGLVASGRLAFTMGHVEASGLPGPTALHEPQP